MRKLAWLVAMAAVAVQGAAQFQSIPKPAFGIYFSSEVRSNVFPCG